MRILLLGDYSNVHATLAMGLRESGHHVILASDGDTWKNYPRDVDLLRQTSGKFASIHYYLKVRRIFRTFRNFDVVQLINPIFLPLKAEHLYSFYRYLRKHNKKIFLGAFGMDYYYVKACMDCRTFRYSDFNFGEAFRDTKETRAWQRDWLKGEKGKLNRWIANDCDGIIAGLYEYYASYQKTFPKKLSFIPFPIKLNQLPDKPQKSKLRFFIGIQSLRSAYKGTDIMLHALERVVKRYPQYCEMIKVESLPFEMYVCALENCDVLLDQLYSYTPAMNALEAMGRGLVVVGGGEPENYEILKCEDLRPIINVRPTEEDVYNKLCQLVERKEELPSLSSQSRLYIERYHDYRKVAQHYLSVWNQ